MSLEKKGWPKKRAKKRDWILTDPDFTQHESSLRTAISQTIANEELSGSELAKHIGLDLIIGALQTEAVTLLEDSLNRSFAAQEKVVRAILRSSLREEYVCFDLDNQIPSFSPFWRDEDFAPGETIVAVIGSVSKTPFHGLAFSDRSLHYAKGDEHWSVSYVELHQLPIKLGDTISQLILGKTRVIDLKGLGVPRRAIQPALSMVGKCIYELSCAAWQ
jgi:hypothetical protein